MKNIFAKIFNLLGILMVVCTLLGGWIVLNYHAIDTTTGIHYDILGEQMRNAEVFSLGDDGYRASLFGEIKKTAIVGVGAALAGAFFYAAARLKRLTVPQ